MHGNLQISLVLAHFGAKAKYPVLSANLGPNSTNRVERIGGEVIQDENSQITCHILTVKCLIWRQPLLWASWAFTAVR